MRTRQIPIALPDAIRDWYQRQADSLGIPLATFLRMKLIELQTNVSGATKPVQPAVQSQTIADDGPDLTNAW